MLLIDDPDLKTKSLGMIAAPGSFANDLDVLKLYQSFSSEIVRLSILGISANAAIVLILLNKPNIACYIDETSRVLLVISMLTFGVATAAALLHRYISSDSMACQLVLLRAELRKAEGDDKRIKKNRKGRSEMFEHSKTALWFGVVFISLGALFLAGAISWAIA